MLVFLSFNFAVNAEQHQGGNDYFSEECDVYCPEYDVFDEFCLIIVINLLEIKGDIFIVRDIIDDNNHENDEQNNQNAKHLAGFAFFEDHISKHEDGRNRQSANRT